jgi:hypothetical protein
MPALDRKLAGRAGLRENSSMPNVKTHAKPAAKSRAPKQSPVSAAAQPKAAKRPASVATRASKSAARTNANEAETAAPTNVRPKTLSYGELVKKLADEFGVKVGALPKRKKNPYRMSAEDTNDVLRKAGVLTPNGNLAARFK